MSKGFNHQSTNQCQGRNKLKTYCDREQASLPSGSSSKEEEPGIQHETSNSSGGGGGREGGGGGRRPWQLNKSVLQANRYMLDNRIACDICFEVGLPDGTIENVYAHKYQLIARSPIFEAKLTTPGSESVRIPDIEPLPFKQLLRCANGCYCDRSDVSLTFGLY